ncbi:DNA circularization N-terminal domain-containing protein [bacterium]|nr:DNA circularization N-terminal domain-containing protein [bacterium]
MGWKESLLPASFRGVAFEVSTVDGEHGRRIVDHDFPGLDQPRPEDMGRRARRFVIEGFLVGTDYLDRKQDLINACEAAGVGELVHPYRGTLRVVCYRLRTRESERDGGMVTLSMEFGEAGEELLLRTVQTADDLRQVRASTLEQVRAGFREAYDLAHAPADLAQDALDGVDNLLTLVGDARRIVGAGEDFRRVLENIISRKTQVAYDAEELSSALEDLFTLGTDPGESVTDARGQFDEMRALLDQQTEPSYDATDPPAGQVDRLAQGQQVSAMAGLLSVADFDSAEDLQEASGVVLDRIEALIDASVDGETASGLADLRAALMADLNARTLDLPSLVKYTPAQDVPALVLSWELYQDVDHESLILARNKVEHPGFVPGGREIEVVTDA